MAIRIFEINDCDWWAGDCTPEEILAAYLAETGCTREEAMGDMDSLPTELSDEALDRLKFVVCDDVGRLDPPRTFRTQLAMMIADGTKFPCSFATTEY